MIWMICDHRAAAQAAAVHIGVFTGKTDLFLV